MPDAEPLAETIETDATDAGSEIVDLTDAAVADLTDAGPAAEPDPDAATGDASATSRSMSLADGPPPADRRDRFRKVGAIVFITVVVLGAATVTLTRSPFFAARTIDGSRCFARAPAAGVAYRGRHP